MAVISDYLDWRGDLPFSVSPLNEVDCYLLCKLVDPDCIGILPEAGFLSLDEATARYFAREPGDKLGVMGSRLLLPVLRRLPETVRFRDLRLGNYVRRTDDARDEQFSALTVLLPDGTRFVTYRGTDDTLAAWREDLLLSVRDVVGSQEAAARYLLAAAAEAGGPLWVGGHSKGGNLAVYAALRAPRDVQDRLAAVYNYDGPGFRTNLLATPGYLRIRPRVHTLASQHTMTAKLLCHEPCIDIVSSTRSGVSAHDGLRWEVLGTRFVRCAEFSVASKALDAALDDVRRDMGDAGWEAFISGVFDVLAATGAVTLSDLTAHKLRQAVTIARELKQTPAVYRFFLSLAGQTTKHTLLGAARTVPKRFRRGGR